MKYTAIILAVIGAAVAQDIGTIPQCARKCITDAIKSATSCGATDYKCACRGDNFNKIQAAASGCVVAACGKEKADKEVLPAVKKFCGK